MDNRQQYPDYDYSTLEVAHQSPSHLQHPSHLQQGQDKYPVQHDNNFPEAVTSSHLPQVVQKQEYVHNAPPYGETNPNSPTPLHPQVAPQERRIWGLKRKTFLILLAVLLVVVIGAVVGGAVGATVGKNKNGEKNSDPASSTSTAAPSANTTTDSHSAILKDSKISAINWTDSNEVAYHGVFWQAKNDGLMVSIWNSKNNSWVVNNITASLNSENAVIAKSGTPLAAAVLGAPWTQPPHSLTNGLVLFFLSPRNVLESVVADISGKSWSLGILSKSGKNYETHENSQLTIWWSLCSTNCSMNINLWYEDKEQTLRQGIGAEWSEPTAILSNIAPGGAIAATAIAPYWGLNGTDSWSPRIYYEQSGSISELMHDDDSSAADSWAWGQTLAQNIGDPPSKLSAVGYYLASNPAAGNVGILLGMNVANGSVLVNYWNNVTWHGNEAPTMLGKVYGNYTSIGMFQGEDIMFYGLTNDSEIHSYKVDRRDPLSWTYGDIVKTS